MKKKKFSLKIEYDNAVVISETLVAPTAQDAFHDYQAIHPGGELVDWIEIRQQKG